MTYILRQLVSILIPVTVTVIIPFWLHRRETDRALSPQSGWVHAIVIVAGVAALVIGITLVLTTVTRFATKGKGTLAPWDPPQVFVVEGVYRYVRNPMISGVLFVLLGESVLTGSRNVLIWFGLFLLNNLVYIPLFEEPQLEKRFGERYRTYKQNVPRWIPRARAWIPPWENQ